MKWWEYDALPSGWPYDWAPATKGEKVWDQLDFHLDLGCGRVPKARMGIDHHAGRGVDLVMDLDSMIVDRNKNSHDKTMQLSHVLIGVPGEDKRLDQPRRLPFPTGSIRSIVTHHCLEHIGDGFERLMEESYRVLEVGGIMRIITPLFPSYSAVAEYDHKRYFMEGTLMGFCAEVNNQRWTDGFAEPYNECRFKILDEDYSPPTDPERQWTTEDAREMRVTLWKHGDQQEEPDPFSLIPKEE
jgi:SAM-dependent methyltransferase